MSKVICKFIASHSHTSHIVSIGLIEAPLRSIFSLYLRLIISGEEVSGLWRSVRHIKGFWLNCILLLLLEHGLCIID